ncbi:MAG TPA: 5-oxoprolinase subunit PxpA [Candidatus Limnocylindria bacterium]|nr:5-oxoprolinase subunit PxpA [Candidatus Limnocylindria bacterium]
MSTIDLNSDLGEGAGTDAAIMPLITSANVACGAHAGDDGTMRETVRLAKAHGVAVGAHPGYRDPANFGRQAVALPLEELTLDLVTQIEALARIARSEGVPVVHVKAHGALYNTAQHDPGVAGAIAAAVLRADPRLLVFAFPASALDVAARAAGLRVVREGFIDRAYEPDGTLRSRALPDALVTDPGRAAAQALSFVRDGGVPAGDGSFLRLSVDTLCVHGDTGGAAEILRAVRAVFDSAGVRVGRAA